MIFIGFIDTNYWFFILYRSASTVGYLKTNRGRPIMVDLSLLRMRWRLFAREIYIWEVGSWQTCTRNLINSWLRLPGWGRLCLCGNLVPEQTLLVRTGGGGCCPVADLDDSHLRHQRSGSRIIYYSSSWKFGWALKGLLLGKERVTCCHPFLVSALQNITISKPNFHTHTHRRPKTHLFSTFTTLHNAICLWHFRLGFLQSEKAPPLNNQYDGRWKLFALQQTGPNSSFITHNSRESVTNSPVIKKLPTTQQ